jgi:hypothetical protein
VLVQLPSEQVVLGHAWPQPLQFAVSWRMLAHAPWQHACVAASQTVPQAPQWALVVRSTQAPSQHAAAEQAPPHGPAPPVPVALLEADEEDDDDADDDDDPPEPAEVVS